jgi:hypothetical protein
MRCFPPSSAPIETFVVLLHLIFHLGTFVDLIFALNTRTSLSNGQQLGVACAAATAEEREEKNCGRADMQLVTGLRLPKQLQIG